MSDASALDPYEETGSLFGSIAHAASSVAKKATKVVHGAQNQLSKVPVVGKGLKAVSTLALSPYDVAANIVAGQRIDKAVVNHFKTQLGAIRDVAPYVQTIISFVPGIGNGISGAMGAAIALAQGKPITEVMIAAARGALPGGPLAAAAFDAAHAAIRGQSISDIALAAVPLPPEQKDILRQSLIVAKDIANGKRVDKILLDRVNANLKKLPGDVQRAAQVGIALGQGQNIQKTLVKAATSKAGTMNIPGLKNLVSAAEGTTRIGITKAVGAAQALKNGSPVLNKSLKSVASQFAPGSHEHHGFMTAVKVLKDTTGNKNALGLARRSLPSKAAQNAFDIAIGTVSNVVSNNPSLARRPGAFVPELQSIKGKITANQPNLQHAIDSMIRNPTLVTQHPMVLARQFGTSQQVVLDAIKQVSTQRLLPWRSLSPRAASFVKKWTGASTRFLSHNTGDTAGLDETGTKYIVAKGDSPFSIAKALTGNGGNWTQLKALNTDKKPDITKNVWVGEVLNIPASWQKPVVRSQSPGPAVPSQPAPQAPSGVSTPAPAISVAPGIMQGKTILLAWAKTDGVNQAGVSDYGAQASDLSTTFGPRDGLELQSFQNWSNKTGNASPALVVDGKLGPKSLAALQHWAETRASQAAPVAPSVTEVIPGGGVVTTLPETVIVGTPPALPASVPVSVTPSVPVATPPALPPIASPAAPATPATVAAANPSGSKMGPALAGAAVGGVLFGLPGAIIGGIAGAAIS